MCELWHHCHTPLETGRYRSLPLQRLWPLPQNERYQPTVNETGEKNGKMILFQVTLIYLSRCKWYPTEVPEMEA